jgi:DNA (cytosine-5)-methyltransferase 1
MVNYSCSNCQKIFKQKGHYEFHINRKTPCKKDNTIERLVEEKVKEALLKISNSQSSQKTVLKFIDLFCGMGSFHYSFKKFNWECVMACDINNTVKNTYKENYGITPLDDVTLIDPSTIQDYDILCAGFPCQPFSQCGYRKGFEDKRGTLFFNIMKFVTFHKPKFVILENVQGLLSHDKGETFSKIRNEIESTGYLVKYKVLKCSDYGLPQMRKRLFIIGIRNDIVKDSQIESILNLKEYEKKTILKDFLGKNFEKDIAYTIRCGGKRSPINDKHNWDGYIVDGKEYRLSIDDCLKLQGFDNTFKLCGNVGDQWKQLGNTIPTIFTEIIGKSIYNYLDKKV